MKLNSKLPKPVSTQVNAAFWCPCSGACTGCTGCWGCTGGAYIG